ncbi:XdhC family protein [Micromonospora sp. WMMA1363]|uniref:XdhC family protein n=1 Tax=Micromonospora sp. WMMA1363 TaxID=3053985 RepID=UPI00259CA3E7|nr:XdhC/CoxI family protein [Micromonospora sp. WMMA1363]MDM4719540.1 XdhC family protein [Micromonospora sp. WMMA1363]
MTAEIRHVAPTLRRWCTADTRFAVATVVGVSGDAPCAVGTVMAIAATGEVAGGVAGGCVDGAVFTAAQDVIGSGRAHRNRYAHQGAGSSMVGLACRGEIDVVVLPAAVDVVAPLLDRLLANQPVASALVLPADPSAVLLVVADPHGMWGSSGDAGVDEMVAHRLRALASTGGTQVERLVDTGGRPMDVLCVGHRPAPRMLVYGMSPVARAVSQLGRFLGFDVTVCDPRPVFVRAAHFPDAHQVVCDWPHRHLSSVDVDARTAIVVLSHDDRHETELLSLALRGPAGYVGVMGSRDTHRERLVRLAAAGLTEHELWRLRAPIGLDLGARTPQETAVSICAELVITAGAGGTGRPLTDTDGPIHRRTGTTVS